MKCFLIQPNPVLCSACKWNAYLDRAGIHADLLTDQALLNLDVAVQDSPLLFKNAGILFFARAPFQFISNNKITCARFDGTTKTAGIIDRDDFQQDLLSNVDEALRFVRKNTRTASKIIDFQRVDKTEYPNEAGFDHPDRKRWARHQSNPYLWKVDEVQAAIRYTLYGCLFTRS